MRHPRMQRVRSAAAITLVYIAVLPMLFGTVVALVAAAFVVGLLLLAERVSREKES